MSSTALRFHHSTLSFIPHRRERRITHSARLMRLYISRRRLKQAVRKMLVR